MFSLCILNRSYLHNILFLFSDHMNILQLLQFTMCTHYTYWQYTPTHAYIYAICFYLSSHFHFHFRCTHLHVSVRVEYTHTCTYMINTLAYASFTEFQTDIGLIFGSKWGNRLDAWTRETHALIQLSRFVRTIIPSLMLLYLTSVVIAYLCIYVCVGVSV